MGTFRILTADAFEALAQMEPESACAVLCDPPYGLTSGPNAKSGFMGAKWDHGVPSKELWALVLRALRPGAPLLAFGGTRTSHRLVSAIEDAGFEVRDQILYLYGAGFPKSHSIGKAIDKAAGKDREVIGIRPIHYPDSPSGYTSVSALGGIRGGGMFQPSTGEVTAGRDITAPATPEAALWEGYGSALKPAFEPVTLAMKPLDGTYAHNALTHGVAGLNIEGTRIETSDNLNGGAYTENGTEWVRKSNALSGEIRNGIGEYVQPTGRWPANVILDGESAAALDAQAGDLGKSAGGHAGNRKSRKNWRMSGDAEKKPLGFGDSGGPSRFFYTAKVSTRERSAGLPEGMANNHPCCKPLDLCRYLATLLLPPDTGRPRRLLVPFSGSGSEMLGGLLAGFDEVWGIEMNPEYVAIAEARIAHWTAPGVWDAHAARKAPKPSPLAHVAAE